MTRTLYNPTDIEDAYDAWKANCGPAALAAVLGFEVMDLRDEFPRYPARPWTNPTHMREALDRLEVRHRPANKTVRGGWPMYGLAFVQVDGPWCDSETTVLAAYRHTHWVGVSDKTVFDINRGVWMPGGLWKTEVMPEIVAATQDATGFWLRTGIEVYPDAGPPPDNLHEIVTGFPAHCSKD